MSRQEYIREIDKQIKWHDQKSGGYKRAHMRYKMITLVSTSMISLLAAVSAVFKLFYGWINIITVILATLATILKTYADEAQYHDLYISYRITSENLSFEKNRYLLSVKPYNHADPDKNLESFVIQCENILKQTNDSWKQFSESLQNDQPSSS